MAQANRPTCIRQKTNEKRKRGLTLLDLFFFKQKTAYEKRPRDWSSDVCSSDLWLDTRSKAERGDLLARGETMAPPRLQRSGERRVAEECRSRWSPCD